MSRFRNIPHLFGKSMVVWCVGVGTLCSLWALRILSRTGQDAGSLLTPILAFFGGELALMFGRSALQHDTNETRKEHSDDGHYEHS